MAASVARFTDAAWRILPAAEGERAGAMTGARMRRKKTPEPLLD
jgi:hypothetical protein